jgi:4-amino-4-deoxy-L-arabinose transferase-like glycosyltransferase
MSPAELAAGAARRPIAALLALALVVAFSFQGSRGLYETTEGRYAESALEMLEGRHWLEPTLDGRLHWTKPPLTYWTIAAGIVVAGPNGWGARLGGALAFVLTVLLVAAIGETLWDRTTGFVAGLVYLSSPFPAAAAAVVSTDTLLALLEVLAVFLFLRGRAEDDPGRARAWVRGMWLAFGLAFLTKGPAALLPLLPIFALTWLAPRRAPLADPLGLAGFAVVASSWYAWAAASHPGLLGYFFHDEVVGRTLRNEFGRNPEWWKPFIVYLPALVLGQGAWLVAGARVFARERLASPRALLGRIRRGDGASFLLLWLVLPLAVLWASTSRLPLYVLPIYPPIALAIARALVHASEHAARRALAIAVPSALLLILLKAGAAFAAPASDKDMRLLYEAARREGGAAAEIRAFGESRLYGLQYYLGGALQRSSPSGGEPWADERLADALAEMERARGRTFVVVTPARRAPELAAALDARGLPFRRSGVAGRELFVVRLGEATPAAMPALGSVP